MQFGASMFFTDYSMTPSALGQALEERGFESIWAAEHSHIPLSRRTPFAGGGELPKQYTMRWIRLLPSPRPRWRRRP
jgi:alkanesulfonate monooxygenase SsuD/methylene tetrahydromethanopterin reductase-like flavin-dependent oxidoreductase (luciferase family)